MTKHLFITLTRDLTGCTVLLWALINYRMAESRLHTAVVYGEKCTSARTRSIWCKCCTARTYYPVCVSSSSPSPVRSPDAESAPNTPTEPVRELGSKEVRNLHTSSQTRYTCSLKVDMIRVLTRCAGVTVASLTEDAWIISGLRCHVTNLGLRSIFGNNWCRFRIMDELHNEKSTDSVKLALGTDVRNFARS